VYLTVLVPACRSLQPPIPTGAAPSESVCKNAPKSAVTQGGCVVIDRAKGNCMACHEIAGTSLAGNLGPPLNYMKERFHDKKNLRAQIWDATAINPRTIMPPFGKHGILTDEEIDKVVEFLLTL
jgi:sulfur-oxidizing protein SoxX